MFICVHVPSPKPKVLPIHDVFAFNAVSANAAHDATHNSATAIVARDPARNVRRKKMSSRQCHFAAGGARSQSANALIVTPAANQTVGDGRLRAGRCPV